MVRLYRSVNIASQEEMLSNRIVSSRPTVLIFDSGVGGLSVYHYIRQALPSVHYIYAFDNGAFPYSEKSEDFIIERVLEIVSAVQQCHPIVIAVIACNTASTISLLALRKRFSFPVVGVVPAIKPAADLTVNGIVGLLATRGTIQRHYIHELIARYATGCKIELLGSSELVELAEAKLHGEVVPLLTLKKILDPWLKMTNPPDTVVLGCTHFSLLEEELMLVLFKGTRLVDSGAAVARRIVWLIAMQKNFLSTQEENLAYCVTLDEKANSLLPVLRGYGLKTLRELAL
ncbi:Glutamate racemase [Serratia symbiotica]|nr:Glutamate racemase [Serratia symbiotica]